MGDCTWPVRLSPRVARTFNELPTHARQMTADLLDIASRTPGDGRSGTPSTSKARTSTAPSSAAGGDGGAGVVCWGGVDDGTVGTNRKGTYEASASGDGDLTPASAGAGTGGVSERSAACRRQSEGLWPRARLKAVLKAKASE